MYFKSSAAIKLFFASQYVRFWQALVPVCQIPVMGINLQPLRLRSPQSSSPSPSSHLLKPEAPSRASVSAEPCLAENQCQFNKYCWKLSENAVTQMTIANVNIYGEVLLYLPSRKSERIALMAQKWHKYNSRSKITVWPVNGRKIRGKYLGNCFVHLNWTCALKHRFDNGDSLNHSSKKDDKKGSERSLCLLPRQNFAVPLVHKSIIKSPALFKLLF